MDKLTQYLVVTFCIGATLALFSTLEPWVDELSGETERLEKEKLDAESCPSYTPIYIDNVLFCQCSDTESQKPNKCNEKYKND